MVSAAAVGQRERTTQKRVIRFLLRSWDISISVIGTPVPTIAISSPRC